MKIRAFLLIALIIGGMYTMIETINDFKEKSFPEFIDAVDTEFAMLTFTKPMMNGSPAETWSIDDEHKVDELLQFLENYHVKKLKPEEIDPDDNIDEFSISLRDSEGNNITIVIAENLIIQNSLLYYEIVDGPLDVDWIVRFFVSNQS
ncbi:hypothetical protein M3193_06090 [Sporosarcina luteola]|uniref:hypothetical protein n=1 Tax=Sporosarcina luteola TaxID=582850 RepID=UPI00203B990D|nr:hypothetical protein [Sporosarcina luteola]MCM3743706.1 hypothetical protein [Sporosarcina luteola]